MKKTVLLIVLLLIAAGSVGCGKYVSHYSAVGFVHSNESGSAFMTFYKFEGTMVFKLNRKSENQAVIKYSGKLEEGEIIVYYDCGGTKKELFSLHSGDELESSGGELPEDTVYIIVETDGSCQNGDLRFEIYYG
ncbi:MAG: hypothetical protein IJV00_07945 [Clostridia bacterium]|nr:hypothetical protein [Clostridia bacterium]